MNYEYTGHCELYLRAMVPYLYWEYGAEVLVIVGMASTDSTLPFLASTMPEKGLKVLYSGQNTVLQLFHPGVIVEERASEVGPKRPHKHKDTRLVS